MTSNKQKGGLFQPKYIVSAFVAIGALAAGAYFLLTKNDTEAESIPSGEVAVGEVIIEEASSAEALSKEKSSGEVTSPVEEAAKALSIETKSESDANDEIEKKVLLEVLTRVEASQKQTAELLKSIAVRTNADKLDVLDVYSLIEKEKPADPLEEQGWNMEYFDRVLSKYGDDPSVGQAVHSIINPSLESNLVPEDIAAAQKLTVHNIVAMNSFMFEESDALVKQFISMKIKDAVSGKEAIPDARITSLTIQAIVAAKFESKFNLKPAVIEAAIILNENELSKDNDFVSVNLRLQAVMAKLMSTLNADMYGE